MWCPHQPRATESLWGLISSHTLWGRLPELPRVHRKLSPALGLEISRLSAEPSKPSGRAAQLPRCAQRRRTPGSTRGPCCGDRSKNRKGRDHLRAHLLSVATSCLRHLGTVAERHGFKPGSKENSNSAGLFLVESLVT